MSRYLISLDPSFTRTGICVIDLLEKKIEFFTAACKIGEKQFENVVHAAQSIVDQLKEIFKKYDDDYDLIHESPLPMSSMSSALYSLDTLIYHTFEPHIKITYNPATLRSKIHRCKYTKTDSVNLANKYLGILLKNNYQIKSIIGTKKKINNDTAEAFLYAHLYLYNNKHTDFMFNNDDDVLKRKARLSDLKRREKLLLSGKDYESADLEKIK